MTPSRVPRRGVMLKHHQAESLVAAMAAEAQSTRDPAAPPTVDIGESAPPLGQEEQPAEETPEGAGVAEGITVVTEHFLG